MRPDHYQALGVHPQATPAEIRAAYLRVMRAHHPDRRPGDPRAAEIAREANAAWMVLRDSARRASYDRVRGGGAGTVVQARPRHPEPRRAAYSAEGRRYRRAFRLAALRLAAGVFVLGLLLLFAVGPR